MVRQVTERDFRIPEFADADPKDYEFRGDGKLVRKDRWESGIRSIASAVGCGPGDFEIPDVVLRVKKMAELWRTGHKERFREATAVEITRQLSNSDVSFVAQFREAFHAIPAIEGEMDTQYMQRCIDLDFEAGLDGFAVLQQVWNDTK